MTDPSLPPAERSRRSTGIPVFGSVPAVLHPVRRGRPGHDLTTVLAMSVRVFNERGFDATSIEDLARALKVGKSAIYHHVGSKDALLGLALDHALTGLEEVAEQARALPGPAIAKLEMLVRGSVQVLVERLPYVTLLLRVRGNSAVELHALERRRQLDHLVAGLVKDAVGQGDLRPDTDPAVTARLLFGLVNSLAGWVRPGRRRSADLADLVAAVAFHGLRA